VRSSGCETHPEAIAQGGVSPRVEERVYERTRSRENDITLESGYIYGTGLISQYSVIFRLIIPEFGISSPCLPEFENMT
jgi:hypothetical protein